MRPLALTLLLFAFPHFARSEIVLTIERTGTSVDFPVFTVKNVGGPALTSFSLTIGDASKHFDSAQLHEISSLIIPVLVAPDDVNGDLRTDTLAWTFTDFLPGEFFSAKVDIDRDSGAATVDWQETLFNNGDVPNAVLSLSWEDDSVAEIELPDDIGRDPLAPYIVTSQAVPEASSLLLLGSAALSIVFLHGKRQ